MAHAPSEFPSEIVITGAGLVTPLGLTRQESWRGVREGRCGMGPLRAMESPLPPGAQGGQAPDLPADFAPDLPREVRYLRSAILQAMSDAQVDRDFARPPERCGILLGTTLHGMRSGGRYLRSGDFAELGKFLADPVLRGAAADLPIGGPALTTCSACSSSLGAIVMACALLRSGALDVVIAGGYDTISEYVYAGFNSLRLVAPGRVRPFARDREGMKLAEGYGVVVLERAEDARRRGAKVLACVRGFGESADAHHLTQPHPRGEGAARAVRQALASAGLGPDDIDLIAAHATGTPDNDAGEYAALSDVFGPSLARVPVAAFKSHLGHTLGAAGAVELILSAMALRDQIVPACANVSAEEVEFPGLNLATGTSRPARIRATLNLSLGFGGANTCVVLTPPAEQSSVRGLITPREVLVTGIGVILPGIVGTDALMRRLQSDEPLTRDTGSVDEEQIAPLLNARRVRRMSMYVRLSLAATALCLRDAGIETIPEFAESCAAVLGTTFGSTSYSEAYYGQIVAEGIASANPMLFAEGVPNAAAAHLSLMLSLKGPCQTVIGSRTAGLDALRLAATRIANGEWHRALVGAGEEYSRVVNDAFAHHGLYGPEGFVTGAGAVTFLLESRESFEARDGRRIHGRIGASSGGTASPARVPRVVRRIIREIGDPALVVGSANATWIARAEAAGIGRRRKMWSPYGRVAECASVLPLIGVASLLAGHDPFSGDGPVGILATDYSGAVSALTVTPERNPK